MTQQLSKQLLAFRKYPEPQGTDYYEQDLLNEKQVVSLFDYCQILEAIIYKEGWDFLIKHFGVEKLFELNNESGWLDSKDIEEYKADIVVYRLMDK